MSKIAQYLEQYALISLEKQDKLAMIVGDHVSEPDLDAGKFRIIETELTFPFQVLGTESDNTLTWLWAWSDVQTEIPENLLASSLQLRAWGEEQGVQEFSTPAVDLNGIDGHALSMIATAVLNASCYYRDAYEGGALFLLLFSNEIERQPSFDIRRLSRQFADLIARYDVNHRKTLAAYLHSKGLHVLEQGPRITAELASGEDLDAEFDDSGNLVTINGEPLTALM